MQQMGFLGNPLKALLLEFHTFSISLYRSLFESIALREWSGRKEEALPDRKAVSNGFPPNLSHCSILFSTKTANCTSGDTFCGFWDVL